ncbi:MAG: hypothetical protein FWC23_08770 [Chitinispirillia bacterium]|nr:hypothetical protein [Chitinispirillia bacterium]MCL2269261.1 hypothetical protein [Chitinispirillia bacterium]
MKNMTTTLLALAALAVIAAGCGKTAERKDAAPVADTVQTAAAAATATLDTVSGTFTDSRDGKAYRVVKIGTQAWMAENLNFVTDSSVCYKNDVSNCQKYGRLYNWNDAMKACPVPWRVPSDEDWDSLALAVGGQRAEYIYGGYDWKFAGKKLKSTTGWKDREDDYGNLVSGNGTDEFGFSALPGGYGYSGVSGYASYVGVWWSTTEDGADFAWYRHMGYDIDYMYRDYNIKTRLRSLRCVRDFAAPQ